jgi:predicted metal-dependent hydrolase
MTFDWTHGPLAKGLRHYNATEFFAAHEDWESIWLNAPQPEKTFLQALIQVTVALHHMQRGNPLGTTRLLTAALRKLEAYTDDYANIAVTLLRDDIADRLQLLTADPPPTHLPPPRIHPLSHESESE